MVNLINHYWKQLKNNNYFIVCSQERDPLGRLVRWIDKAVDKTKKFLGLKFSALKVYFFSMMKQKFFIFTNNIIFLFQFCSTILQFLVSLIRWSYSLIHRTQINQHFKIILYIILTLLLVLFFIYFVYFQASFLKKFLLGEFFHFLRNFKNPFKGTDPAECMNSSKQPPTSSKLQTGPYDMYKTTNSTYGGFAPSATKAIKKTWIEQKKMIKDFHATPTIQRLSPGRENLLIRQRINETNVFKKDWSKDEPIFYAKQQLAVNEVNRVVLPPLVYGGLGALASFVPAKTKSTKLGAASGATSGGVGFYFATGLDEAIDKHYIAAGKAAIKHQGLEVKNGFLVGGPEIFEKKG